MEVRFPDDAPMYEIICGGCNGPTHAGGFITKDTTAAEELEECRKYSVCGSCGHRLRDVGCTIRVFDTPDSLKGKTFQAQDPFQSPKEGA